MSALPSLFYPNLAVVVLRPGLGLRPQGSGRELHDVEAAQLLGLHDEVVGRGIALGIGEDLVVVRVAERADLAHNRVRGFGASLVLGVDYGGAVADAAERLAKVAAAADEEDVKLCLTDVLQDLGLHKVPDVGLGHDQDGDDVLDVADEHRVGHLGDTALHADVGRDELHRRRRTPSCGSCLWRSDWSGLGGTIHGEDGAARWWLTRGRHGRQSWWRTAWATEWSSGGVVRAARTTADVIRGKDGVGRLALAGAWSSVCPWRAASGKGAVVRGRGGVCGWRGRRAWLRPLGVATRRLGDWWW